MHVFSWLWMYCISAQCAVHVRRLIIYKCYVNKICDISSQSPCTWQNTTWWIPVLLKYAPIILYSHVCLRARVHVMQHSTFDYPFLWPVPFLWHPTVKAAMKGRKTAQQLPQYPGLCKGSSKLSWDHWNMPSAWYSSSPSDSVQLTVLWRVLTQFKFWIRNDELWRSFITCRVIECRLQIAIGTSNLETTVSYYNVHVFSWLCTYCITGSAHVWLTYNIQVLCKQNLWYFITNHLAHGKTPLDKYRFCWNLHLSHCTRMCARGARVHVMQHIVLLITLSSDLYHSCVTPNSQSCNERSILSKMLIVSSTRLSGNCTSG